MELELGLKITQTRDDVSSTTDLRIIKDGGGDVFLSRETETMFILTAHLKGYRREHIDIKINEDGTRISISGNKPVQEKVMLGWIMYKKDVELRGFRKVFIIPEGVVLDKIKAKFNEDSAILTIFMPKLVKGVRGYKIEEAAESDHREIEQENNDNGTRKMDETDAADNGVRKIKFREPIQEDAEEAISGRKEEFAQDNGTDSPSQEETNKNRDNEVKSASEGDEKRRDITEHTASSASRPKKCCKICIPVVAGSALLVSLIVFVIQLTRAKKVQKRVD